MDQAIELDGGEIGEEFPMRPGQGSAGGGEGTDLDPALADTDGSGEKLRMGFGMIGAKGQDIGGADDVEKLTGISAAEEEGGTAVDDTGEHRSAGEKSESAGGGGRDPAGDLVGL